MISGWPGVIRGFRGHSILVGRAAECQVSIPNAAVSGRHFTFFVNEEGAEVNDLNSLHGTRVNGAQVVSSRLQSGDVIQFAGSPPYQFEGNKLVRLQDRAGMEIRVVGIDLEINGNTLLENVSFTIMPGQCVGVLGPSGAGKSLVVGCLSSTLTPTGGEIFFDGDMSVPANLDLFRSQLGIVTQDDLVHPVLSVEENLYHSGRLRLSGISETELGRRIQTTLEEIDLINHRHKLVKVLSGGQRKRVSVAIELLMRPRLIVLDEPTSGLDPGAAFRLMDVLRNLARRGTTVICTTHSLDTLYTFDSCLVLGTRTIAGQSSKVGTLVYHGEPAELYPSFGVNNPADLFDKLKNLNKIPEAGELDFDDNATDEETPLLSDVYGFQRAIAPKRDFADRVPFLDQVRVVKMRSFLSFLRDKATILSNLIQPVLLAILTVMALASSDSSISIHFFLVVAAAWIGATLTVREIVKERKLYVRDRLVSMNPAAYLLGKLATAASLLLPAAMLLYCTARLVYPWSVEGVALDQLQSISWNTGILALWLTAIGGAALGLMVSTVSRNERFAVQILPIVIMPQILLSRVVSGDLAYPWSDGGTPYAPLQLVADYSDLIFCSSVSLITRPATAVIDMQAAGYNDQAVMTTEWIYFVGLTGAYLAILYGLFRARERTWITECR